MGLVSAGIINVADSTLVVLDGFEAYTAGNDVTTEAAEWGQIGTFDSNHVGNTNVPRNTQCTTPPTNSYSGIQSNTATGAATDQTGTFSSYPYAPATIRSAFWCNDANGRADMAFAVPETEGDLNTNCYRIRGGIDTAPFIRRTVDDTSTNLSQMTNSLTSGTIYDWAVEFEATGTSVDMTLRVWEWDSANTTWVEHDSEISASDGNNNFPNEGGVGLADFNADTDAIVQDYFRFYDSLGENGVPAWTPDGSGSTITIVDSFEDGDVAEYSGDTASVNVVSESNAPISAVDGTQLLEVPATTSANTEIFSNSGLTNYYSKGDGTLNVYWYQPAADADIQRRFWYGAPDASNGYEVRMHGETGEWDVLLFSGDSFQSVIANADDATFSEGIHYRLEITWDDGTLGGADNDHTVELYNDDTSNQVGSTLTFNDGTHATAQGHKFRLRQNDATDIYWDYLNYE